MRKIVKEKTVEELVPRRFWKWKKVFEKEKLERIPTQKPWDHTIELKERFVPRKRRVYSLLREEKEEIQVFIENQLQKGYIQPSKLPDLTSLFCSKEGWKKENSTRLSSYKLVNGKKWVLFTPNCKYPRWSGKEGVYEN